MTGYRFSDEVRADERGAGDGGAVGRGGDEHGADHGAADERVPDEFVADENDADERDTDQRDVHTGNGAIADATPKADVVSNATAVIDAKRKPLRNAASLTADFAKHGYPPPHRLALLFPRMPAAEQAALTTSIRAGGIRDPITIFNGQIAWADDIASKVIRAALRPPAAAQRLCG
jgi:hypothetical protein